MPPLPTPYPIPTGVPDEVPPEMIEMFWNPESLYPAFSSMQTVWLFLDQYHFLEIAVALLLIYMAINWMWDFVQRHSEDV